MSDARGSSRPATASTASARDVTGSVALELVTSQNYIPSRWTVRSWRGSR
jgi:hypothetical protein